jgi:hypothetical protein
LRKHAAAITATLLCAGLFVVIQPQTISDGQRAQLAKKFQFTRMQLPEPTGAMKEVRGVHPSLKRLNAWISATGAGVALTDLDGDGKNNDIIQIDPRTDTVALLPVPGSGNRFERFVLDHSKVRFDASKMASMGALATDVNEDGLTDIVVYYWGRTPVVFLRKGGSPTASSFSPLELVQGDEIWNTSTAVSSDFDGDGHQDLLFCNYFQDGAPVLDPNGTGTIELQTSIARAFNGGKKHLLRFVESSPQTVRFAEQPGIFSEGTSGGWTIAVGACDLDGDHLPEIYLANDTGPDRLLHNSSKPGKLRFSPVQGEAGFTTPKSFVLGNDSFKGMGIDFADINRDGMPDIYVSNIATQFGLVESHFVWMSSGDRSKFAQGIAPYKQSSEHFGLSRSGWSWDCRMADFNNDGELEAVQATGFLRGEINRWPELQAVGTSNSTMLSNPSNWPGFGTKDDVSGQEKGCFFARAHDGKFYDIAPELGLTDMHISRGIALGDVDADGDVDMVVANQWGPSFFYQNESKSANGITLKLMDGKRSAIGAKATLISSDGSKQTAIIDGGSGHAGKRAPEVHFGVGDARGAFKILVEWRAADATVKRKEFSLAPGWHNIDLSGGGDKA